MLKKFQKYINVTVTAAHAMFTLWKPVQTSRPLTITQSKLYL